MSEINQLQVSVVSKESSNDSMAFSKKNAWKNEWEKAQLDNSTDKNSDNTKSEENIKFKNDDSKSVNHLEISSDNIKIDSSMIEKNADITDYSQSLGNAIPYNSVKQVAYSVFSNESINNLNVNMSFNALIKAGVSIDKSAYASGVIEKTEILFNNKFMLQNLNVVKNTEGVKILLRDYKLDDEQLNAIVNEIKTVLGEFGIDVNKAIVNGVVYE